ncbi:MULTISPECIES: universal stress protein [Streptomyces]|uniref:universal stress protein n=1 Tax=Streptomyces TaxID=1883 RepID=UPI0019651B99|nr:MULTISPECIES: universal stress protein [Streptomyces]QRX90213.1 universal stress protein [Streptomyces noursei]UJB40137.1 universal stress protein [Streptomyces sp. A1-5]
MDHAVTVGLDGSAESLAAARWAAGEADRRGLPLRLLHAWPMLAPEAVGPSPEVDQNYWAKRIVHDAQTEIHERYPNLPVVEDLVASDAETALLRASARSELLILGSRGLSTAACFFLGDTSMEIVARAERPVVLVRAGMRPASDPAHGTGGVVVVGVSLHGRCDDLLEFAFEAAALREVPLHAVHGRSLPVDRYVPWAGNPDVIEEITEEARQRLGEALRSSREKFPGVRVIDSVLLESPSRAVVRAASAADLLVIGRRRQRPALAPRLGNVAHAAAHHASCPVAIVPHD